MRRAIASASVLCAAGTSVSQCRGFKPKAAMSKSAKKQEREREEHRKQIRKFRYAAKNFEEAEPDHTFMDFEAKAYVEEVQQMHRAAQNNTTPVDPDTGRRLTPPVFSDNVITSQNRHQSFNAHEGEVAYRAEMSPYSSAVPVEADRKARLPGPEAAAALQLEREIVRVLLLPAPDGEPSSPAIDALSKLDDSYAPQSPNPRFDLHPDITEASDLGAVPQHSRGVRMPTSGHPATMTGAVSDTSADELRGGYFASVDGASAVNDNPLGNYAPGAAGLPVTLQQRAELLLPLVASAREQRFPLRARAVEGILSVWLATAADEGPQGLDSTYAYLEPTMLLYHHMKGTFTALTTPVVEQLMLTFSLASGGEPNERFAHQAVRLLTDSETNLALPSKVTIATFIDICAANGMMNVALMQFANAKEKLFIEPNATMCHAVVQGLVENNLIDEAIAFIGRLEAVHIDTPLMNACLEALMLGDEPAAAFSAYESMVGSGTRPNSETFSALLDVCERTGQWDPHVRMIASEMQQRRVRGDDVTLNHLLKGFLVTRHDQYASQLFLAMIQKGVEIWPELEESMPPKVQRHAARLRRGIEKQMKTAMPVVEHYEKIQQVAPGTFTGKDSSSAHRADGGHVDVTSSSADNDLDAALRAVNEERTAATSAELDRSAGLAGSPTDLQGGPEPEKKDRANDHRQRKAKGEQKEIKRTPEQQRRKDKASMPSDIPYLPKELQPRRHVIPKDDEVLKRFAAVGRLHRIQRKAMAHFAWRKRLPGIITREDAFAMSGPTLAKIVHKHFFGVAPVSTRVLSQRQRPGSSSFSSKGRGGGDRGRGRGSSSAGRGQARGSSKGRVKAPEKSRLMRDPTAHRQR